MRAGRVTIASLGLIGLAGSVLWAGHTLTASERKVLSKWLRGHRSLRPATVEECACTEDVATMRRGYGGNWKGVPGYHPYMARGDFNGDGVQDFALVLVDRSLSEKRFAFVVFNGPFDQTTKDPAFSETGLDLAHQGLFFGPPRPKPYRLVMGAFESEGGVLEPKGSTYSWVYQQP